jgi:hypothetical protein
MKAKLPLFALFALLLLPALALAGEAATPPVVPGVAAPAPAIAVALGAPAVAIQAPAPVAAVALPPLFATADCAAPAPAARADLSIGTSLVCDGVNYPFCSPGGSCSDPCCYCECRAEGFGPGICVLECCRNM